MILKIFSYGTIQDPKIQRELFGELKKSTPDAINGFQRLHMTLDGGVYPVLIKGDCRYYGHVYDVTPDELKKLDEYEGDAYIRIPVDTEEKQKVFIYILNPKIKLNLKNNAGDSESKTN